MKRMILPPLLLAISSAFLLGSTLSYFTDRADTVVQGTAGSLRIQLIPDVDLTGDDGNGTLIPGDGRRVYFRLMCCIYSHARDCLHCLCIYLYCFPHLEQTRWQLSLNRDSR